MSLKLSVRPRGDGKSLQDRLHELISRIAETTDIVKDWPESEGDDASIHVETKTKLIASIRSIVKAIQRTEGILKDDERLNQKLEGCPIPLDLLDLLDHANGLNPECFTRGLLREALGQLAGLRRRKVALEMLGTAIQNGLNRKDASIAKKAKDENDQDGKQDDKDRGMKRERSEGNVGTENEPTGTDEGPDGEGEPPRKKVNTGPLS